MLERQWCAEHPDRPSHAICMSCRKTLCQECASELEGIHYCLRCIATLVPSSKRESRLRAVVATALLTALLAFGLVRLAVGIGAFLAGFL